MAQLYPPFLHKTPHDDRDQLAISPQQMQSVIKPQQSIKRLIRPGTRRSSYIGRPYLIWRDDLELARMVNDRLAESLSSAATD